MTRPADSAQGSAHDWAHTRERSNLPMLRLMVWISLTLGRTLGRVVLHGIALYFVLFAPAAQKSGRDYLRRVLGRAPNWLDSYRHVLSFASTIHDRIYLLNDRFDLFEIEVEGAEDLDRVLARDTGVLLFGAHLGSFELLRAVGCGRAGLQVAMMMYEDNARRLNATLASINPRATQEVIPLGQIESMLSARDKLDQGYVVGILADRASGPTQRQSVDFLGAAAAFPLGPFRMAAILRRPVFFMTGLYLGGNRYRIHFAPLADFTQIGRGERDAAIRTAVSRYAGLLETHCRAAPYNWFNFFDFWEMT